jgi:hypothetical protein
MQKIVVNLETGEQTIVDLTPEEIAAAEAESAAWQAEQAAYVPPQVPMWAVRTVLQNDGLFDQAQALVTASTDNALKNVWEYGNFADRTSPSINALASALGLTSEQVDQMFRDANALTV